MSEFGAGSQLKFSSVSSTDTLPLGCEHQEYYWIKRYRALKRRVESKRTGAPVVEEEDETDEAEVLRRGAVIEESLLRAQASAPVGKIQSSRFYLEDSCAVLPDLKRQLDGEAATSADGDAGAGDRLGPLPLAPGRPARAAMLRTQQSLVISPVSSRWFVVDTAREMKILIGATTEGLERLQPACLSTLKLVSIQARRGDRIKLLATPALGYAPCAEGTLPGGGGAGIADQDYMLCGDLTIVVNNESKSSVEHEFAAGAPLFGVAIWYGSLSDVRLIDT